MSKTKLEDCPFCGSEGELNHEKRGNYYVSCADCEATAPGSFDKEEAIGFWNRRVGGK